MSGIGISVTIYNWDLIKTFTIGQKIRRIFVLNIPLVMFINILIKDIMHEDYLLHIVNDFNNFIDFF